MDIIMLNENEDITSTKFTPMKSNMPINPLVEILSKTILELNSFQIEMAELQSKFIHLQRKNRKLVDNIHLLLVNLNQKNNELNNVYSQCDPVEVKDLGINCNLESDSNIFFNYGEPINSIIHSDKSNSKDIKEKEFDFEDKNRCNVMESIINFDKEIQNANEIENQNDKTDNLIIKKICEPQSNYSKEEMLIYLSKFKIDFLKFVQCNHNTLSGGCSELIQSFSTINVDSQSNNDEKLCGIKTNNTFQSTKRKSQQNIRSAPNNEIKNLSIYNDSKLPVVDSSNYQDPELKSNLYDDLDFQKNSNQRNCTEASELVISEIDINKIGGVKRINRLCGRSKSNLLKKRINTKKVKKKVPWKTEILEIETSHEVHYPEHVHFDSIDDCKNETIKPQETVFTTRMKKRLNTSLRSNGLEKSLDPMIFNSKNLRKSLACANLNLLPSEDSKFQFDECSKEFDNFSITKEVKVSTDNPRKILSSSEHFLNQIHKKSPNTLKKIRILSKDLEDRDFI